MKLNQFDLQRMDEFNRYSYAHRMMGIQDRERMKRMNGHPQLKLPQTERADEPAGGWKAPVYVSDTEKHPPSWEQDKVKASKAKDSKPEPEVMAQIDRKKVTWPVKIIETDGKESYFRNSV